MNGALIMDAVAGLIWIVSDDGMTLKASGYPISIERTPNADMPYRLHREGKTLPYWTLEMAKKDAERTAREIDEFARPWKQ